MFYKQLMLTINLPVTFYLGFVKYPLLIFYYKLLFYFLIFCLGE